ncbi:TERF1-interacting nuclear factor 2 [Hyla sarda]|uniref:TERF1-interacting nuclear factor 2 n=1 Tax=Hyla sarda TaxID=327740 RepID=UPI0024C2D284|nr:TERF1-interacting nuclear factor 2 [Hyla sarda]
MSEHSSVTSGPYVNTGSSLPVLVKAVWLVMKKRDVKNFGKVLEFLEFTHEQVPGLLCYTHHAKLSTGLRGKIVLHMVEEKKPLLDILTALNCYFPPVFPDASGAAHRKAFKVQQCKVHFRKLVLRMIRDEKFRENFAANTLHLEYGDTFMAVLEKLLWEFLCRLQTVLNYQVPQATELPVVDEDLVSSTPIHSSTRLNVSDNPGIDKTKEKSKTKKHKANITTRNVSFTDKSEENPNTVQAKYVKWQHWIQNKQNPGRCNGTASLTFYREVLAPPLQLDLVSSHLDGGHRMDEPQPPYFAILGFDCSENTEINHCQKLSPPDPLQSPGLEVDLEHGSEPHTRHDEGGHGSYSDIQVKDVAKMSNHHPLSRTVHAASGGNLDRQGNALAQRLMSWTCQPRVSLTRLPPNIKYQGHEFEKEKTEENMTPELANSELSHSETYPHSGSWSWVCSGPTDNDSNDPDFFPGHSFFHHGEEIRRIQPRRGLRLAHNHE